MVCFASALQICLLCVDSVFTLKYTWLTVYFFHLAISKPHVAYIDEDSAVKVVITNALIVEKLHM